MSRSQVANLLKKWGFKIDHYDPEYPELWAASLNEITLEESDIPKKPNEKKLVNLIISTAYSAGEYDGKKATVKSIKEALGLL